MVTELTELFTRLEVADPVQTEGLQLFGVRWQPDRHLLYQTMEEALAAGSLKITEVSEGGSVPVLTVANTGDTMVLIIAGEQLIGAKQNRVVNATIMVAPKSETRIDVTCVERGRWGYKSHQFDSSGSSSHYVLRRIISKSVRANLVAFRVRSADQSAVWEEVDRKLGAMGSVSPSAALEQTYVDYQATLDRMLTNARVPAECNGVVFAFGDRIAGMDLFDRPETLNKLLPKLVRAYGIDAAESTCRLGTDQGTKRRSRWPWKRSSKKTEGVSRQDVASWLHLAPQAHFERFPSAGLGDDVRIESGEMVGAGLVVEQQPVHVELFTESRQTT